MESQSAILSICAALILGVLATQVSTHQDPSGLRNIQNDKSLSNGSSVLQADDDDDDKKFGPAGYPNLIGVIGAAFGASEAQINKSVNKFGEGYTGEEGKTFVPEPTTLITLINSSVPTTPSTTTEEEDEDEDGDSDEQ